MKKKIVVCGAGGYIGGYVDTVEGIAGIKLRRSSNLKPPIGVNGRNSDTR